MFGATIAVPLILSTHLCMDDDPVAVGSLISTIFFVSGIATLLQSFFGNRSVLLHYDVLYRPFHLLVSPTPILREPADLYAHIPSRISTDDYYFYYIAPTVISFCHYTLVFGATVGVLYL